MQKTEKTNNRPIKLIQQYLLSFNEPSTLRLVLVVNWSIGKGS